MHVATLLDISVPVLLAHVRSVEYLLTLREKKREGLKRKEIVLAGSHIVI